MNNGINHTFNESEHNGVDSDGFGVAHEDSPIGHIEKNFNQHKFSFDSMINYHKNEHTPNQSPFYPRKQSIGNPFDKLFNAVANNYDMGNDERGRRLSSNLSPYNIPSKPPQIGSPNLFYNSNAEFKPKSIPVVKESSPQPPMNFEDNPVQK